MRLLAPVRRQVPARLPHPAAVVAAATLTALTLLLLAGHGPWSGPPILGVSRAHGVNLGDIPVLLAWLVGLTAVRRLDRTLRGPA